MLYRLLTILIALLFGGLAAELHAAPDAGDKTGSSAGESIYRDGLLPDGRQLRGTAIGNIPMTGEQVACVRCHRRSGLGTSEGSVISWRISGAELYQPRRRTGAWLPKRNDRRKERIPGQFSPSTARPAYTDESLARLLRTGIDPTGAEVNPVMPRYELDDTAMSSLVAYLKGLSSELSPGVSEESIRFATVVTDDVDPQEKAAMLDVLGIYIRDHNTQTRPHLRRIKDGPFYRSELNSAYRKLELDVWKLKGDRESWPEQLEQYYAEKPVFALLGGLAGGSWKPIHDFCETHRIPSIFPLTDQPVIDETDWYTLYFSKGLYQEGVSAAFFLQGSGLLEGEGRKMIQLYPKGGREALIARGMEETLSDAQRSRLVSLEVDPASPDTAAKLESLAGESGESLVLVWMNDEEFLPLFRQLLAMPGVRRVFGSWTLLSPGLEPIAKLDTDDRLFMTYPYALPESQSISKRRLAQWLKVRGIEQRVSSVEDRIYFLGWLLSPVLRNMRNDLYRDYFLENFEMMRDQERAIALYPRVSFAAGQRYASKGGYVVRYDNEKQGIVPVSRWNMRPLKNLRLSGGAQ